MRLASKSPIDPFLFFATPDHVVGGVGQRKYISVGCQAIPSAQSPPLFKGEKVHSPLRGEGGGEWNCSKGCMQMFDDLLKSPDPCLVSGDVASSLRIACNASGVQNATTKRHPPKPNTNREFSEIIEHSPTTPTRKKNTHTHKTQHQNAQPPRNACHYEVVGRLA